MVARLLALQLTLNIRVMLYFKFALRLTSLNKNLLEDTVKIRMTRKKNKFFIGLGLVFLSVMVASGYALVLSQNNKVDLGGQEIYIGFLLLVPSAIFTFVFLGMFGLITMWINYLIKTMGNSHQSNHLRKTFSWLVFEDNKISEEL